MTLSELPEWASELVANSRVAHLGLLDSDGHPRVLPVTFALAEDAAWSAIDEKPKRAAEPARLRYLRRRPEAALCVDVYADDWGRLAWVQLLGRVEIIEVDRGAAGLDALRAKYEQYAEASPPGPLLRIEPRRALCWRAAGD